MQSEVGEDAIDAAFADFEAALTELLGDDFGGRVRVEEAMADGLADDFRAATIVAFGASFFAAQSGAAFGHEGVSELEVALATEAVSACGFDAGARTALSFDQHGQFACDLIVFWDGQSSVGSDEGVI